MTQASTQEEYNQLLLGSSRRGKKLFAKYKRTAGGGGDGPTTLDCTRCVKAAGNDRDDRYTTTAMPAFSRSGTRIFNTCADDTTKGFSDNKRISVMGSLLYVKLDATYYMDDKIVDVGEAAEILYIRTLCLAKNLLTDGLLSLAQIRFIGLDRVEERIDALVNSGLWTPVENGWLITAWLKHNQSAEQIRSISEIRRESGRKGGKNSPLKQSAQATPNQNVEAVHKQVAQHRGSTETEAVQSTPPPCPPNGPWAEKMKAKWRDIESTTFPSATYLHNLFEEFGPELPLEMLKSIKLSGKHPHSLKSYLPKACKGEKKRRAQSEPQPVKFLNGSGSFTITDSNTHEPVTDPRRRLWTIRRYSIDPTSDPDQGHWFTLPDHVVQSGVLDDATKETIEAKKPA